MEKTGLRIGRVVEIKAFVGESFGKGIQNRVNVFDDSKIRYPVWVRKTGVRSKLKNILAVPYKRLSDILDFIFKKRRGTVLFK